MFVRIAYNPGQGYQQHLHQSDMAFPDGTPDAAIIREVEIYYWNISGIAVLDGDEWRTIQGSMPTHGGHFATI